MELTSTEFGNNGIIPAKYTCDGENVSPPLEIAGVPEGAKSLVLIVDDPDASNGTWVHWTLWNVGPDMLEIMEDSVPDGSVHGATSFAGTGWGGPCPHSGVHRYFFKLYALDATLDLAPDSNKATLEAAMDGHVFAQCELVGRYSRKQ